MFCLFAANHADFSLISLNPLFLWFLWPNYAFVSFLAPKTCFGLFAAKLGCSGLYVTKRNVFLLLLLNYSGFSIMTPKRCFRLFVAKFVLFSALFHWRLSFELFAAKLPVISLFRLLPLNWAIFSLITPKKVFCLFSANHPVSQTTVFLFRCLIKLFLALLNAVFSLSSPKKCLCILLANDAGFSFISLKRKFLLFCC